MPKLANTLKVTIPRAKTDLSLLNTHLWRLLSCILLLHLSCTDMTWAQTPATERLGFLQLTGEVNVNGMRAADGQTIFPGDTVRTGPDGVAVFTLPDIGTLTIENQTEISFRTSQTVATLKQGTVDVRSLQGGANLDVQFGKFVLLTSAPGSTGILAVDANGAARVECRSGSIGVTAVAGPESVFLQPGQSVSIAADGTMQPVSSTAPGATVSPATARAPGTAPAAKKSRTAYYIWGAAGAGGVTAAVVVLLVTRKPAPPVSPATP